MVLENKKWAFTELLGCADNVQQAIQALKAAKVLHGQLSSNEEKGEKRFVQFYQCSENLMELPQHEANVYEEVALLYRVNIEYSYMGSSCRCFPKEDSEFSVKYWEWWMTE